MDRVHLGPPWQVAQLKPGWTSPTVPNRVRPAIAPGSVGGTGARAERTLRAIQMEMESWRESRPLLLLGRKLVTPGGKFTPRPRRARDRLPRVTQAPLGVPGGPGVPGGSGLLPTLYSRTVVWSAPVLSTPPMT